MPPATGRGRRPRERASARGAGSRPGPACPLGRSRLDYDQDAPEVPYTSSAFKSSSTGISVRVSNLTLPRAPSFTDRLAIVSSSGHTPGKVRIFKGQSQDRKDVVWAFPQPELNPYQLEWDDFVDAIINNKSYNEVPRGVEASLVTSMGRMAAHTGQEITYEQMLNCPHEFAPNVANFTADSPAPVLPDSEGNGTYPLPMPGVLRDVEYKA